MEFFRKHLGKIALLGVIAVIATAVLYYMKNRDYQGSFEERFRAKEKTLALAKNELIAPTPNSQSTPEAKGQDPIMALADAPERMRIFSQKWREVRQELAVSEAKCKSEEKKALPDNTLIDVNDPFYNVPDRVLAKYQHVLSESLFAAGAGHAANLWEEALMSDVPLRYEDYARHLAELNICKGQRSLVFVDTVLESLEKKMWPAPEKKELVKMSLGHLEILLSANPATTQNLAFALNILINLSGQNLIARDNFTDLEELYEKVIEAEDQGRELSRMDRTEVVKRELLRDQWRNNKYLASEISELLKRIQRE